jgi:hypothetical protein
MRRRGVGLVEALITLTVLAVTASLWMRTLVAQDRQQRAAQRSDGTHRAVDDVLRVLTATFAGVPASDTVRVLGDTALELRRTVGVGVSCAQYADSVLVVADGPHVAWEARPDSADVVMLDDAAGRTTAHQVVSVRDRAPSAQCAAPGWRLHVVPARASPATALLAIRVLRRVRLTVYRGSDGHWWFGERRCGAPHLSACGAAQPIAGPLPSPRGGLLLAVQGAQLSAVLRDGDRLRRVAVARLP